MTNKVQALISFRPEPKTMARALRTSLAERGVNVSHSDALELVARQFGCRDWNVLAARHDEAPITPKAEVDEAGRVPEGWFAAGRKDLLWHG